MGGKNDKQVTGYWYRLALHFVACLSPVDGILAIRMEQKRAWTGFIKSGRININKKKLFGGEKRQGGFIGDIDFLDGNASQSVNDFMSGILGDDTSAYRGVVSLVYRRPRIGANNPYLKPQAFKIKSVYNPHGEWLRGISGINGQWPEDGCSVFVAIENSAAAYGNGTIETEKEALRNWIKSMVTGPANLRLVAFSDVVDDFIEVSGDYEDNRQDLLDWVDGIPPPTIRIGDLSRSLNPGGVAFMVFDVDISEDPVGTTYNYDDIVTGVSDTASSFSFTNQVKATAYDASGNWLATLEDTNTTPSLTNGATFDRNAVWTKTGATQARMRIKIAIQVMSYSTAVSAIVSATFTSQAYLTKTISGVDTVTRLPIEATVKSGNTLPEIDGGLGTLPDITYEPGVLRFYGNSWSTANYNGLTIGGNAASWTAAVASAPAFFTAAASDAEATEEPTVTDLIEAQVALAREEASAEGGLDGSVKYPRTVHFISLGVPSSSADANTAKSTLDGTAATRYAYNMDEADTTEADKIATGSAIVVDGSDEHSIALFCEDVQVDWMDVNPAHFVRDVLTNKRTGGDGTASEIGDSFATSAQLFFDEGFGLSIMGASTDTDTLFRQIEEHLDCTIYGDPFTGKWEIKPIRNDYVVGDLTTIDKSLVTDWGSVERTPADELPNILTVVFTKREDGGESSVQEHNVASFLMGAAAIPKKSDMRFITYEPLAKRVALREMSGQSVPLWRGSGTVLAYRPQALTVGSAVIVDQPKLGLSGIVARITDIEEGGHTDSTVRVSWVEDKFSIDDVPVGGVQEIIGVTPITPLAPDAVLAEEAPYYISIYARGQAETDQELGYDPTIGYLMAAPTLPNANHTDGAIVEDQSGDWVKIGDTGLMPTALMSNALTSRADDDEITIPYNSALDEVLVNSLVQVGDEIMRVDAMVNTSGTVTLTVGRGALDTVPVAHASGSRVLFFSDDVGTDSVVHFDGETQTFRLLTETTEQTLSPSAVGDTSVTYDARMIRPYPAGDVKADADYQVDGAVWTGSTALTWAHRDRTLQTAEVPPVFDDASVGPESGTAYTIRQRFYDSALTFISATDATTGLTGTSYTLSGITGRPSGAVYVGVQAVSVRNGYEAWQSAELQFLLRSGRTTQDNASRQTQAGQLRTLNE